MQESAKKVATAQHDRLLTHATTYGYDAMNRLASRTDLLVKAEFFFYDVDGNPVPAHRSQKGRSRRAPTTR